MELIHIMAAERGKKIDVVYYHANCQDGMSACNLFRIFLGDAERDVEYIGIFPSQEVEARSVCGRNVLCLDVVICNMEALLPYVASMMCIDHHKSNRQVIMDNRDKLAYEVFNIEHCATRLTFDTFFPNQVVPAFVHCIEARDLFQFELHPRSKEFSNGMFASVKTLDENFDLLKRLLREDTDGGPTFDEICQRGEEVERKKNAEMDLLYANVRAYTCKLADQSHTRTYHVAVVDVPRHLRSDFGNYCIQKNRDLDFFVGYHYSAEHNEFWCSLRSADDRVDVSTIGKGHRNASGLTLSATEYTTPTEFFKPV